MTIDETPWTFAVIFTARNNSTPRPSEPRSSGPAMILPPGRHPLEDTPWPDTPPGQTPHLGRHPLPSTCWDTHTPAQCILGYTPPPAQWILGYTYLPSTCWDTHLPPVQCMLGYTPSPAPCMLPSAHPLCRACWDTVNKRAVRILLECILVLVTFGFLPQNFHYLIKVFLDDQQYKVDFSPNCFFRYFLSWIYCSHL